MILSFVHSCTRLNSSIGILSTTIKCTLATPLGNCANEDLEFLNLVNEFIHNLEPKKTKVTTINLTGKQILF